MLAVQKYQTTDEQEVMNLAQEADILMTENLTPSRAWPNSSNANNSRHPGRPPRKPSDLRDDECRRISAELRHSRRPRAHRGGADYQPCRVAKRRRLGRRLDQTADTGTRLAHRHSRRERRLLRQGLPRDHSRRHGGRPPEHRWFPGRRRPGAPRRRRVRAASLAQASGPPRAIHRRSWLHRRMPGHSPGHRRMSPARLRESSH